MPIENPLVSIVVITYNSSEFVIETLESAKAQTYQNIELIVSDDCSKDNTVEVCRNWMAKNKNRFARTELITVEKNTGTPSNCNRGFNSSHGEWIKPIAGDDILLADCIINNVNYCLQNNCEFVFSDMIWFNKAKIITGQDNQTLIRRHFVETESKYQLHFYARHPVFLNSPTWFFSKKIILDNPFDESFRILEDQPFILSHLERERSISYLQKETIKYRKHNNSVQYTRSPIIINDFKICFNKYRKNNLKYSSVIDLLFILKFKTFMYRLNNYDNKANRFITSVLSRTNPIDLFNINPRFMTRHR